MIDKKSLGTGQFQPLGRIFAQPALQFRPTLGERRLQQRRQHNATRLEIPCRRHAFGKRIGQRPPVDDRPAIGHDVGTRSHGQ